jgi:quercetin dioxygenase-like cupin family protein
VVSGNIVFGVGDKDMIAEPGTLVHVPAGTVHWFRYLKPDVLVAMTTPATAALQAATRTIPIVFAAVSDPVGSGFAAFTDKW